MGRIASIASKKTDHFSTNTSQILILLPKNLESTRKMGFINRRYFKKTKNVILKNPKANGQYDLSFGSITSSISCESGKDDETMNINHSSPWSLTVALSSSKPC